MAYKSDFSKKKIYFMWVVVVFFSALSALVGATLLDDASNSVKAIFSCFAGGAIIAMIASTMLPEAHASMAQQLDLLMSIGIFIHMVP
ncbi:hypothetical protein KHA80_22275 [Anaerobacillus sp. HL2]|nr:hypothetical protein KHA80_22275 [Anaerobacillus sp. HL2]